MYSIFILAMCAALALAFIWTSFRIVHTPFWVFGNPRSVIETRRMGLL